MSRPALLLALVLVLGCGNSAPVGSPDAAGSATASAPPAASAALEGGDAGMDSDAGDGGSPRPPPPRVRALDVPEETRSPLPKVDDWKDAVRRDVAIRPQYVCTIQRVREWHRINCECSNATVSLVTGTRDGVLLWATEERAQLIFPVRRGDRRVLEVSPHAKLVSGLGPYGGPGEQPGGPPIVFSETWLEGEDAPTLVMQ